MRGRLIVADDHPVVVQGVIELLRLDGRFDVVAQAYGPDALVKVLDHVPADVLITDFSMPGDTHPDGLAMLSTLRRRYPGLPVIVMTMFTSLPSLKVALRTGVRGIVDKTASLHGIAQAVARVHAGRMHIDEHLRGLLDVGEGPPGLASLTPCEHEVLRLYLSGPSITEIAARFNRTVSTISRQRISAMRKLGIRTEAELFAWSFEHGLNLSPLRVAPPQR